MDYNNGTIRGEEKKSGARPEKTTGK